MDRLVAQTETEKEVEKTTEETKKQEKEETQVSEILSGGTIEDSSSFKTEYLNSLENVTIADIKKREEEKELKEFEIEKEKLIQQQYVTAHQSTEEVVGKDSPLEKQQESQKTIEKPNYDLLEIKHVVKLKKKQEKKKPKGKMAGLFLAIALGICGIICIANVTIIDQMSSGFFQLENDYYHVNLPKYLKNIANLDTANKSMEFVETYPDEVFEAGDVGKKSNWFDNLCNFLAGLFGG